jgi:thiol-disulfide isomerase/thioredoxin
VIHPTLDRSELRSFTQRHGTVSVDGKPVAFELGGFVDLALVAIDRDGRGKADWRDPTDIVADPGRVRIGKHDYRATVRPNGDGLVLTRLAVDHDALGAGDRAPDFAATLADGTAFRLADARGKTVVLDFWLEGCPPCKVDRPRVEALANRGDVVVVSISPADASSGEDLTRWPHIVERASIEGDLAGGYRIDPLRIEASYGVAYYPQFFVIDAEGIVRCARCSLGTVLDTAGR